MHAQLICADVLQVTKGMDVLEQVLKVNKQATKSVLLLTPAPFTLTLYSPSEGRRGIGSVGLGKGACRE